MEPEGSALGTVVLLDEIDKAEPDLPNDLDISERLNDDERSEEARRALEGLAGWWST